MTTEDIAEHVENVIHAHSAAKATESAAVQSGGTKLVIPATFVGIMQDIISLGGFFEFLLCFLISRIPVRMIFYGHLFIGRLYFLFSRSTFYA